MTRCWQALVPLLFFATAGYAQLPVRIEGLARTQVQWLAAQMPGVTATEDGTALRYDAPPAAELTVDLADLRQRVVNLPAVAAAAWRIDSAAGRPAGLTLTVEEARTLFPLFDLGGVRGNFYYLLGFNDLHFRGRGQRLTAFYQNIDGEHNYYLALANPAYRGGRWGYELESRRYAAVEPLYFPAEVRYVYANHSVGAGLSYTTPNRHVFRLGLGRFRERYRKEEPTATTPGPAALDLTKGLLKASHAVRRLDYFNERLGGNAHETVAQGVRTLGGGPDFLIAWHDWRRYRLVGARGNLAARLRFGLSTNENSPFAPFVLDSQVNIRGSGNRIDRGTAQLILNLEYRHTAWTDYRRFAVQGVAFSDLGTWRNPGGELGDLWDERNLRHFVGAGVRLVSLRAFNALLRLDYGIDVRDRRARGAVVGFGQYF